MKNIDNMTSTELYDAYYEILKKVEYIHSDARLIDKNKAFGEKLYGTIRHIYPDGTSELERRELSVNEYYNDAPDCKSKAKLEKLSKEEKYLFQNFCSLYLEKQEKESEQKQKKELEQKQKKESQKRLVIGLLSVLVVLVVFGITSSIISSGINADAHQHDAGNCLSCGSTNTYAYSTYWYNDGNICTGSDKWCRANADYTIARCNDCGYNWKIYLK